MSHLQPILDDLLVGVRRRAARRRRAQATSAAALATAALAAFAMAATAPSTTAPDALPGDPGAARPLAGDHPSGGALVSSPFAQATRLSIP